MKKQIIYCAIGLFTYLLLNIIATRVTPSVETFEEKSDITYLFSQNDATQNTIRLLYHIYSSPLRKSIIVDTQNYYLKNSCRFLADFGYRNKLQLPLLSQKVYHPYLHPNGKNYYVYTLEKIVI